MRGLGRHVAALAPAARRSCRGLAGGSFPTTPCGVHPLIDVTPLLEPSAAAAPLAVAVQQMGAALRQVGWFYAAGVSMLPPDYIRGIYAYLGRAHALSPADKYRYRQRGGLGSYTGPDVGEPELNYDGSASAATVRAWDYSRGRFSLGEVGTVPLADRYPPAAVLSPPYASTCDELYERQDMLGRALMRGMEAALELPAGALLGKFEGGDFGTIRLLHYPAVGGEAAAGATGRSDQPAGSASGAAGEANSAGRAAGIAGAGALEHGISPHTDFEVFTLMHQDAPGLQFMRRAPGGQGHAKEWVDAPVRLGPNAEHDNAGVGSGLGERWRCGLEVHAASAGWRRARHGVGG
jgi:isopenicillin N synthase-like dioxygenase